MKNLSIYLENAINKNTIDEIQLELINMIKFMQTKLENTQEKYKPCNNKAFRSYRKKLSKRFKLKGNQ